jgi:hypothetical protein
LLQIYWPAPGPEGCGCGAVAASSPRAPAGSSKRGGTALFAPSDASCRSYCRLGRTERGRRWAPRRGRARGGRRSCPLRCCWQRCPRWGSNAAPLACVPIRHVKAGRCRRHGGRGALSALRRQRGGLCVVGWGLTGEPLNKAGAQPTCCGNQLVPPWLPCSGYTVGLHSPGKGEAQAVCRGCEHACQPRMP